MSDSVTEYFCAVCGRRVPEADAKPHGEFYIEELKLVCSQGHVCYIPWPIRGEDR